MAEPGEVTCDRAKPSASSRTPVDEEASREDAAMDELFDPAPDYIPSYHRYVGGC